jgi:serine/threonine-protein kinase
VLGKTISHYKILEKIGEGGMGVVYRATDTKLNRDVALKILPEQFASDTQRMGRFQREAEVLASLDHPNIGQIYGIEEAGQTKALVLQLIEGPTLADKIAQGPIPVEEALKIALQIAEGLEAAHEKGVIHRDLKPANIKITPEGQVKILDFGLAKALEAEVPDSSLSQSPTLTAAATQAGVILGTAAYMSPEQARGKPTDRRADIWAIGVVLFEMLSGKRAFEGEDVSQTLAAVIMTEPGWSLLPSETPRPIRQLLRRCLDREPHDRLQAIGEFRIAVSRYLADPVEDAASSGDVVETPRFTLAWTVVAVLLVTVGALVVILNRSAEGPASVAVVRSSITLSLDERLNLNGRLAFSPDGGMLAFNRVRDGTPQICIRDMDSWAIRCIPGIGGSSNFFFSPDGQQIGYNQGGSLRAVSLTGESPIVLTDSAGNGASWGKDGTIVFNPGYNKGLSRITVSGGPVTELTVPDTDNDELGHFFPQLLDDGNTVIFTVFSPLLEKARVSALRIDEGEIRPLVSNAVFGRYVSSGHLLFVRSNNLMAVPLDLSKLEVIGTPVAVIDDLPLSPTLGDSTFAVTDDGTLAYIPESVLNPELHLAWIDPQGNEELLSEIRGPFKGIALSPDGERVALTKQQANPDIWLYELESSRGTRLTFGEATEANPVWMPDSSRIAFMSDRPPYDLYWQPTDRSGSAEELLSSPYDKTPTSVSPDGTLLVFEENRVGTTGFDIWLLPISGDEDPRVFLQTQFNERGGAVSPSGEWIAYVSNESGRNEVYVQAFPQGGNQAAVSTGGGVEPGWSPDGRTLYYVSGQSLLAVEIEPGPPMRVGKERELFGIETLRPADRWPRYSVAQDGRFLTVKYPTESQPRQIRLVQNWFEELKARVPVP